MSPTRTATGVELTGAHYVKQLSIEPKSLYAILYDRSNTRSIHLEVFELREETFLKVFQRFVSRRSQPRKMLSDNATTYLAAAEELKRLLDSLSLFRSIPGPYFPK